MDGLSRNKGFIALILSVLVFFWGCREHPSQKEQGTIKWMPYEKAIEEAKKNGKPVVVFFVSYTCPICEKLEEQTLQDPQVSRLLNEDFLPVKVLAEENPRLIQHFRVIGFPTIWFYKEGNLFGPLVGFFPPDVFRDVLLHVLTGKEMP